MILETDALLRLLVAGLLGGLVGLERERQDQPAGLRTHMILTLGACLAMIISINVVIQYHPPAPNGDPSRLAAQVVSGIGFLGAGAILRFGTSVRGLTTAASLWTMAIVGMAVGMGLYIASVGATVMILVALTLLNYLEKRFLRAYETRILEFEARDRSDLVDEFNTVLREQKIQTMDFGITKNVEDNIAHFQVAIKKSEDKAIFLLTDRLAQIPGARSIKIHQ